MIKCKILRIDKGLFLYNAVLVELLEDLYFTKRLLGIIECGAGRNTRMKVDYIIKKGERKFLKIKKTNCIFAEGEHSFFKLSDFCFSDELSYLLKIHTFVNAEHKEDCLHIVHKSEKKAKKICKEIFSHGRNFEYKYSSFIYAPHSERGGFINQPFQKKDAILYTNFPEKHLSLIPIL